MTAKQKANQQRFKKVVAEAKKLRAKDKKLTQAQAVKKAWAMVKKTKITGSGNSVKVIKYKGYTIEKNGNEYQTLDNKGFDIAGQYFDNLKMAKGHIDDYIQSENEIGKMPKRKKTVKRATKKPLVKKLHKDTKSHNVNIRVVSGTKSKVSGYKKTTRKGKKTTVHYTRIMGLPNYSDPDAAREIELFADNDSQLYFQRRKPIIINLQKKYKKGTYDIQKAAKLWRYYIDAALQKYNKEFGSRGDKWFELLNTSDRQILAEQYAKDLLEEFKLGNFID